MGSDYLYVVFICSCVWFVSQHGYWFSLEEVIANHSMCYIFLCCLNQTSNYVPHLYRSFIEDSQADIKISPQEHNYVGLNDRLVTLIGTFDEQMRAIFLIMSKLIEDSHYPQSLNSPFPYAGTFQYLVILYFVWCLPY